MGRSNRSLIAASLIAAFAGMFAPRPNPSAASAEIRTESRNEEPKLPTASGHGRRVVFDQSDQRVWLVARDGGVERSYLVTGSNRDNVQPGVYRVNGRIRYARTYRGGGTFEYFVRFTHGRTAPIGFHAVTVADGEMVYTRADMGTPRTPGCVEALPADAQALWEFAPVGTDVIVTA